MNQKKKLKKTRINQMIATQMTQIKLRSEIIKVFKLIKNLEKQKAKSNQIKKNLNSFR